MRPIIVPTINNNDTSCILVEWFVKDGAELKPEQQLAALETSKATYELLAEAGGILHQAAAVGAECLFGSTIGYLFDSEAERTAFLNEKKTAAAGAPAEAGAVTMTQAALEYAKANNISDARIASLGKRVIRKSDLEALQKEGETGAHAPPDAHPLQSKHQAAVAKVVSLSHATIPPAFLLMRVWCDGIMGEARKWSAKNKVYAGLTEILVKAIAKRVNDFPLFFSASSGAAVTDANIGLTFDVGHGLFIPVVRSATTKSLTEVSRALMGFRDKAFRNSFKSEELTDGHISISLNTERDIILSVPIIVPGQTCMVSLGAVFEEVALDDETNAPTRHTYTNLGIAYDHRYINGFQAVQFLNALKQSIEAGLSEIEGGAPASG